MAKGDIISRLKLESGEFDSKIKRAGQELLAYSEHCRKMGLEMGYANRDAKEFAKALGSMQTVSNTARGKINELSEAFINAKVMYKNMTDAEKQGQFGKNLAASLDQLKVRLDNAKKDLADVQKELSSTGGDDTKFGQLGNILDTLGKKMGVTGNLTEMLTSKTAMMTAGIGASVAVIGKATQEWAKYNAELAKQDQVTQVTTGLQGPQANKMTDQARALVDTYQVDFREAINAANTLMTQFGKSGDEAMQLIKDGMRGMIMGDGAKLLSMIQQYAPSFRDAGISASQLVAIIHNSEGGIFTDQNMNAIVMGIKNLRLMTKATSDALAKLGVDGQDMTRKLNDGSMTIFEAMRKVSQAIEGTATGSQAAGEVMQQVFGRQGVAAGTNLGKAIATLNTNLEETKRQTGEVGDAFEELQQANERLNTAIREAFSYDGWEQMATGIKSKLISALATVIDQLGKIRQLFSDFTPSGQTENTQSAEQKDMNRRLAYVRSGSNKQYWNQQNKDYYDQQVSERQFKVNSLKGDDAITRGLRQKAEADLQAWKNLRDEYNKKANGILTAPPKSNTRQTIPTTPTDTKTTSTSHVKTEEQKNNEQIQKLTQEYLKATDKRRAAIRAEIKDLQDKNKELKRLADEAQGVKMGDGSLPALTRQLQEYQQEQAKATDGKEWDEYQKKIDATNDRINVLKGNLPKDKQATFTMNLNAEQLEQLRAMMPTDSTIKVNVEQGRVDLPIIPDGDKTYTVTVTADTAEAMKQMRDLTSDIEGTMVKIEPKVEIKEPDLRTPFEKLHDSIKLELSEENIKADRNMLKSLAEVVTKYDIKTGTIDMSSVMEQTEQLARQGMNAGEAYAQALKDALAANLDLSSVQEQLREGFDIPDDTWQAIVDKINEQLKKSGLGSIKLDSKTGKVIGNKKAETTEQKIDGMKDLVGGVNGVLSGIEQMGIEIPNEIKQVMGVLNGIFTIVGSIESIVVTGAILGLFSRGGVVPHAANGYFVGGNHYSGDTTPIMANAGELVLNKSSQNNLAGDIKNAESLVRYIGAESNELSRSQQQALAGTLEGPGLREINVRGYIEGEHIALVADRWGRRMGKGELLFWK